MVHNTTESHQSTKFVYSIHNNNLWIIGDKKSPIYKIRIQYTTKRSVLNQSCAN